MWTTYSTFAGFYSLAVNGIDNNNNRGNNYLEWITFCHFLGYFIYDTSIYVYFRMINSFILGHHLIGGLLTIIVIYEDKLGSLFMFVIAIAENAHPLMIAMMTFDNINESKSSNRYKITVFLFTTLFLFNRLIVLPIWYLYLLSLKESSLLVWIATGFNQSFSSVWIIQYVIYRKYKYNKYPNYIVFYHYNKIIYYISIQLFWYIFENTEMLHWFTSNPILKYFYESDKNQTHEALKNISWRINWNIFIERYFKQSSMLTLLIATMFSFILPISFKTMI